MKISQAQPVVVKPQIDKLVRMLVLAPSGALCTLEDLRNPNA